MAKMLGVWINVNNPNRSSQDDLNLTVGGTIVLTAKEAKLSQNGLFNVKIKVMDDDTFSDDLVYTNESFSIGVYDTNPTQFVTGVIVPAANLINSEPSYESAAEIYCRVAAKQGNISTNSANSQTVNVSI